MLSCSIFAFLERQLRGRKQARPQMGRTARKSALRPLEHGAESSRSGKYDRLQGIDRCCHLKWFERDDCSPVPRSVVKFANNPVATPLIAADNLVEK